MPGAAWLAAQAAARAGAGLVTIAAPDAVIEALAAKVTVQTLAPLAATKGGNIAFAAWKRALELSVAFDCVAVGPGLSRDPSTERFVNKLIVELQKPVVIDADALNAISSGPQILKKRKFDTILTPHPGEASRLLKMSTAEIQASRTKGAVELARLTGAIVALKGSGTIVTDGARCYINKTGNPGMASGGSGDVLTGVAAAFVASGLAPFEATILAVHCHGRAGDLAARSIGERGLLASDLLDWIPRSIRERVAKNGV